MISRALALNWRPGCWTSSAAEQGVPEAKFNLGDFYRTGRTGQVDHVEGLRWIRENPEAFDAQMARRGLSGVSAEVLEIDTARRATGTSR